MQVYSSVHSILQNIEAQIRSVSDHLTHSNGSRSPHYCSSALSLDSFQSSPHSSCPESTSMLSQHLLQAQSAIHRLKLELATRAPLHDHHLSPSPFLDHRHLTRTNPISSSPLLSHSTHSFVTPPSKSAHIIISTY